MAKVNRFVALKVEPDEYENTWVICDTFTFSFYLGALGFDIREMPFVKNVEDAARWHRRGHTEHALAILNDASVNPG